MAAASIGATPGTATASDPDHGQDHEHSNAFQQVNLVSDLPGVAPLVDKEVKNPWGIALSPTSPLWVANNVNPALLNLCPTCIPAPADLLTKVTVYTGAHGNVPFKKVPLEVTASAPTGMVFNPTKSFVVRQNGVSAPANFLFNELVLDRTQTGAVGEVTGWSRATLPTTTAVTSARHDGAAYSGLALVPAAHAKRDDSRRTAHRRKPAGPRLVAVGSLQIDDTTFLPVVDVFDGAFHKLNLPHAYVDPAANADGLSPYNVTFLRGRVYVAYTSADSRHDAVSVFTRDGRFIKRLVGGTFLAAPWGMAIAPEHWGRFGGALLVGNVGAGDPDTNELNPNSGEINAYNVRTGRHLGTLRDAQGKPLVNPGLWGLAFGNGTIGTPSTLLFAAGIGEAPGGFGQEIYAHGLVGLIKPVNDDDD